MATSAFRRPACVALAAGVTLALAAAEAPASSPDPAAMRAAAEKKVRDALVLPKTARFEWPAGFKPGSWRPYNSRPVSGWMTCGLVYAKDRFGYENVRVFIAVVNGSKAFADFDSEPGGAVERACGSLRFPQPAPAPPDAH